MIYYVDGNARIAGDGTKESPFQTIQEAANIAMPGDEVVVAPGEYHEEVHPVHGGTDEDHRITYRSMEKWKAVITGAEPVREWTWCEGDVWMTRLPNAMFGDYNPYTTYIRGDWYFAQEPLHTGEIYLNDRSMYEVTSFDQVKNPTVYGGSWDPEFTVYTWYTCQDGEDTVLYANFQNKNPNRERVEINVRRRCFFPETEGINYITFSGFSITKAATQWAPPTAFQDGMIGPNWSKGWIIEKTRVSHSKCSGISLGKYYQKENDNKWSSFGMKHGTQTERDAICQAVNEGWDKDHVGGHIVRRCVIHDCGQTGIVGHMGCAFSTIEDNHIHHINNKQDLAGAEIGGIKLHAAIDTTIRKNYIHHCTRGLWLDWQAQGTRVTRNLMHDNTPPRGTVFGDDVLTVGEDIFVEVSHGPTLIDHNILLSKASLRLPTQGVAIVHNLISGSCTCVGKGTDNGGEHFPTPRYTPYHVPHGTAIAGFMTMLHGDIRFYNNIFVQQEIREDLQRFAEEKSKGEIQYVCGTKPYDGYPTEEAYVARMQAHAPMDGEDGDRYYDHLPVYTGGNVYFNGALPCDSEKDAMVDTKHEVYLILGEEEEDAHLMLETNIYQYILPCKGEILTTEKLGMAFEPEQLFENPDGSPITFDEDYYGKKRKGRFYSGPFATPIYVTCLNHH